MSGPLQGRHLRPPSPGGEQVRRVPLNVVPQSPSLWQLDWHTWLVSAHLRHVPVLDQGALLLKGLRSTPPLRPLGQAGQVLTGGR